MPDIKPVEAPVIDMTTVNLDTPIRINGVLYAEGSHKVPSDLAEDLVRINKDNLLYESGLNRNNKDSTVPNS